MPRLRFGTKTNPLQDKGKYGNAKVGPVAPGKDVKPPPEDRELEVRELGTGDVVADVSYSDRTLTVRRTFIQQNANLLRYGVVVGNSITSFNDTPEVLPEVPDWTALDLDHTTFQHGDAIPGMPEGLGYIRLAPGSLIVDHHSWNPDSSDYGPAATVDGQGPQVVHVKFSSTTSVDVYFDKEVTIDAFEAPSAVGAFSTAGYPVVVTDVQQASPKVIRLIISRAIDDRHIDILYVRIRNSLVRDNDGKRNQATATRPVSQDTQSDAYVRVMNRATASAMAVGSLVYLAGPTYVIDANNVARRVYDAVPVGGGGGGVNITIGTVVGGNTLGVAPSEDAEELVYAEYKPHAFPTPFTNDDDELQLLPAVEDWNAVALEDDYVIGDSLPLMPDGLCYVRLERPYSMLGSSWDANVEIAFTTLGVPETPANPIAARTKIEDFSTVFVFWDRQGELSPLTSPALYQLTLTPNVGYVAEDLEPVTIESITYDAAKSASQLTLNRALDSVKETLSINVAFGAHWTNDSPPLASNAGSADVIFAGDKFTMVLAVNRVGMQQFIQGDFVFLGDTVAITDEEGVTKTAVEILSAAGTRMQKHSHNNSLGGPSGGGDAYLTFGAIS